MARLTSFQAFFRLHQLLPGEAESSSSHAGELVVVEMPAAGSAPNATNDRAWKPDGQRWQRETRRGWLCFVSGSTHKSDPHSVLVVMRTMASVGSVIATRGRSSTASFSLPWKVTAVMRCTG